jgi:hypothetical protein
VYQATPLRGLPHALGIMKNLEMSKVPCGWMALLQSSSGSAKCGSEIQLCIRLCSKRMSLNAVEVGDKEEDDGDLHGH